MTTTISQNLSTLCKRLPLLLIGGLKKPVQQRNVSSYSNVYRTRTVSTKRDLGQGIAADTVQVPSYPRKLSVSPAELNSSLEYALPTTCVNSAIQKGTFIQNNVFECPTLFTINPVEVPSNHNAISEPETGKTIIAPEHDKTEKLAKNILKIRRRKMNRHHLKKLRKRMKFVFRKRYYRKKKLKEAKFQAEMREIMKRAEDFNPREFVQKKLEVARKGGFHIDIFDSQGLKEQR